MQCSVLILTFNEETNIERCINSLNWCSDIVILDSISTDKTTEIANQYSNVRIVDRIFDGYASQRNFGLKEVNYKNDWLLMVDADEVVEKALASEIKSLPDNNVSIYRMRRKDMFYGKWLKRSSGYPTWFGRLLKIDDVVIEREINEEYVTKGNTAHLENHLIHYPFSKGISWWFERHNRYSSMEASLVAGNTGKQFSLNGIFSLDPVLRRKNMKACLYSLPFRPVIVFIYLYIIKLGFLDGKSGLKFSAMRACYEFMIELKTEEQLAKKKEAKTE
jgi:glycosyltransferase involved in cell wall biosynthesis